jgi:CubicO group peptidase (beta-lactamase class C family)
MVAIAGVSNAYAGDPDAFTYPDSRAGEIARAWIEQFNSGDDQQTRRFEETYRAESALKKRSVEDRVARYPQLRGMLGTTLSPHAVLAATPDGLTLLASSGSMNMWLSLDFELESEAPHKLKSLEVRPAADPDATGYDQWKDLAELVEQVRSDMGSPALAVAIGDGAGVREVAVAGVRAIGGDELVLVEDPFHVGSITKSMTATIIGTLVDRGVLDFDITLAEALPDIEMRSEYRTVTLEQLLAHKGGIAQQLTFDDPDMARLVGLPGTPTRQRAAYIADVLQMDPVAAAGTDMNYSNAGYAIAGHIAEVAAGSSWETLIVETVFEPIGMTTAALGWPAMTGHPDRPRGHFNESGELRTQGLDEYALGSFLAPAGDVHCSAKDLANYGRAHLNGLNGKNGVVSAKTIRRLHTPIGDTKPRYAGGWVIKKSPSGDQLHWHNGSAGTFYASLSIWPDRDLVIAVLANSVSPSGEPIIEEMNAAIFHRLSED